jgi:hypothetical protein
MACLNAWKMFAFPLAAVNAFCERPWRQRVWTVQEMAVAKEVLYMCGNRIMFEEFFLWAFFVFSAQSSDHWIGSSLMCPRLQLPSEYQRDLNTNGRFFQFCPSFMMGTRMNFKRGDPQCLLNLLFRASNIGIRASDPRDHVFALLGIAADAKELGIRVDYSHSVIQVFTYATMALFSQGYLNVLSYFQSSKRIPGLPSWVPDWSAHMELDPLIHERNIVTHTTVPLGGQNQNYNSGIPNLYSLRC